MGPQDMVWLLARTPSFNGREDKQDPATALRTLSNGKGDRIAFVLPVNWSRKERKKCFSIIDFFCVWWHGRVLAFKKAQKNEPLKMALLHLSVTFSDCWCHILTIPQSNRNIVFWCETHANLFLMHSATFLGQVLNVNNVLAQAT